MSKLDKILVVDVEATCWDKDQSNGKTSEIIEIGICPIECKPELNRYFVGERESLFVNTHYSKVSPFCEKLTGITQQQLDENGFKFTNACTYLQNKYRSNHYMWASYGDYDCYLFARQCKREKATYPFIKTHLNIKNLFALLHGFPAEVGMAKALQYMEIPLEGRYHSGGDDAYNIAKLLAQLLNDARGVK